ncbi:type II toxin-antitoxin system RelE/ParE family toxin [Alkalilimnicola sp. S0819]|uniref:type II toxin-antitoxin system RelE/ParE family toxin n=1 Tax=Alkalilimnicola sp. S0819 TaxID=2613922 RepID=UPI0012622F97|nr:type II toxin-antitoxin system RelE/ParE family toxin [Alkalilimnicola sp. S0819]KAB7623373.1 type II toxin-antitoxin system RelE/ParE family toxin [Alkalilimnicola sp. S0819]MPQ16913.1 type II toxin-antitoxin system RelE/ParE family toxin [Alkalilimnicola sp. S0819]
MNIVWSPLALERVEEYAEYIALDSPAAAVQWVDEIFAKVDALAGFPEIGRSVPELSRADVRELFHGQYRIIYRVDRSVFVLTVRHTSQLLTDADVEDDA